MQHRFNPLKPNADAPKPRPTALKKGTITTPLPVGPAPIVTENEEKDGLELRFPKRPGPAVLEFFHGTKDLPPEQRWHFHFKGKYWYAKRNEATRKFAQMIIAHSSEKPLQTPQAPVSQPFVPKLLTHRDSIIPTPMEAEWQAQTAQGLTQLSYDVWVEKFIQAQGDTHPEPVEPSEELSVIPVNFQPVACRSVPVWKKRLQWGPPCTTDASGRPATRY